MADEYERALQHPDRQVVIGQDLSYRLYAVASFSSGSAKYTRAEPLMRRALEIAEASLGPNHPWTQTFRKNLEYLTRQMGR